MDGDRFFHYGDWLALDRTGAAANSVYGRLMKHTLRTSTMRQVHRLLQKQQRCLDWKKRDRNIRKSQTVSGRRERRIFYCYRKMCGEDADRAYSCAEVSSV